MLVLLLIGFVAGAFSAIFGLGGGIITVPLLLLLTRRDTKEAAAISLGAIVLTALAGVLVYGLRGEVRFAYAALLGIPASAGAFLGAGLQRRLSNETLTYAFAGLLVAVAVWLLVE